MGDSPTPPNSATTVHDSIHTRRPDEDDDDDIGPLDRSPTLHDTLDQSSSGKDDGNDPDFEPKPLQRTNTYVREFWKFHMRATDDDEEQ